MNDTKKGNLFLLLSALVWGFAIVAQKKGMDFLGPFGFTTIRCLLGGISMIPIVWFIHNKSAKAKSGELKEQYTASRSQTIKGAFACGFFLTALILFQQFGLPFTSVGKAAFITALYIPITPILESIFGNRISKYVWIGGGIALVGMYLLTMTEGISKLNFGDMLMLGAALCASLQMIVVDRFVRVVEPVKLSCYQFIVTGLICLPFTLIFETVTWDAVNKSIIPILYAGLISCGIGYCFQVIGQKFTTSSQAAIVLSLETVFSLFAGFLFYKEMLTPIEYVGCAIMFGAILISQKQDNKSNCSGDSQNSHDESVDNI